MKDFRVSTHSPLCSDGSGSFLLCSVLFGKTTRSVYTLPGALMVQDLSYVTQYPYGRLQGQYTLSLVLWWSRILLMWLSIVLEDFKVSKHSSWCSDVLGSFLCEAVCYGRLQGQYTLPLGLWWSWILPTWFGIVMEDFKVSIHSPLCSDGPGSFLLYSVSLGYTTRSVYTLPGAMIDRDPFSWTQYYFGRLQGKYTLSPVLSWSMILSLWLQSKSLTIESWHNALWICLISGQSYNKRLFCYKLCKHDHFFVYVMMKCFHT